MATLINRAIAAMRGAQAKTSAGKLRTAADEELRRSRELRGRSEGSRADYTSRLDAFDPMAYIREQAGAVGDQIYEEHGTAETARRGDLNRRGILMSDLGGGRARRDLNDRVSRASASLADQAARLNMGLIDRYGGLYDSDVGQEQTARFTAYDLLAGDRDYKTALENAKKQRRGGLLGGLGSLAGGIIGGPLGAGIGGALGQGIGGFF